MQTHDLISTLVPLGTATVEARHGASQADMFVSPTMLFPGELAFIQGAVEKRRCEFAVGRALARQALAQLGYQHVPILVGAQREPVWPDGVIGSITHCQGYCAAAVRRLDAIVGLGIDAETNEMLPAGVVELIARPEERAWLRDYPDDGTRWDKLLFSAKESVFKAWFPATRRWLEFLAARVRFDPAHETFHVTLVDRSSCEDAPAAAFTGRYLSRDGFVVTACALGHGDLQMNVSA